MARWISLGLILLALSATPALAQKSARSAKVEAIPSRTWNSAGQGGLIEGACVGVKNDQVVILADNVERLIPPELFHADDLETIRAHFKLQDDFPGQETVDSVPLAECEMLHTIRGGVFPSAKIIGHDGDTVFMADDKGLKYRVPYFLFADVVKVSVRDVLTRLDGEPFQPEEEKKPAARKRPTKKNTATKKRAAKTTAEPEMPPAPDNPVVATPVPAPVGNPRGPAPVASVNAPDGTDLTPIGAERVWTMRGGKATWRGKFLQLKLPALFIETAEGKTERLPFNLLEDADRAYAEALAKNGTVGAAPTGALVVSDPRAKFLFGSNGNTAYVLDGRTLHTLSAAGKDAIKKFTLAEDYSALCERDDYWVAASEKELHLLDKKTLQPIKKHELWKYKRINDLSLHPKRPLAIVSVEHVLDEVKKNPAEDQRIVLVEEATGKVHEPAEAYGKWVRVHPSGKYLLAGFHSAFKNGPDEEFDATGRLVPRLNYEHLDILNRFRIDGFELPLDEQFENAGANGQDVVLSPDGAHVAYLSFTGYPTFSYNVAVLDALDFKKRPITFAMKDKADCKRIVFSPRGDLAASPITGGALLYDARTGKEAAHQLAADTDLEGAIIHDLAFSLDGQRILFIASRDGSPPYVKSVLLPAP